MVETDNMGDHFSFKMSGSWKKYQLERSRAEGEEREVTHPDICFRANQR